MVDPGALNHGEATGPGGTARCYLIREIAMLWIDWDTAWPPLVTKYRHRQNDTRTARWKLHQVRVLRNPIPHLRFQGLSQYAQE